MKIKDIKYIIHPDANIQLDIYEPQGYGQEHVGRVGTLKTTVAWLNHSTDYDECEIASYLRVDLDILAIDIIKKG